MHKRFYLTIAIVLIGIIAIQIFGFRELSIVEVDAPKLYVVGQTYTGFSEDEEVKNYLKEAKELIDDKKLKGNLSTWYFGNPDQWYR